MAAHDFLGPDELLARRKNLAHGGGDDPHGDAGGDEGIENRITGKPARGAGGDGRKGYVASRIAALWRLGARRSRATPQLAGRGEEADHDGDRADDRSRVEYSLHRLPQQQSTDEHEADRV